MRALALACLLGLPAATAHAEFYRWVDADGQARVSNVLYVPGSETLVISDFACNVRDYERLIEALDVPLAELAPGE